MSGARRVGKCKGDIFELQATALMAASVDVASGYPVKDGDIAQVALAMALQACVNAAADLGITAEAVVKAFGSGFASWTTSVIDHPAEAEDALIAFRSAFLRARTAIVADGRAE